MRYAATILFIILLFCSIFRLYRFSNPIADWHSWRQADTSAVSYHFATYGFDVLHPTYFDISNVQSGRDNPQGYRFVEFPLYNVLQAGGYAFFGYFTLDEWGRIITILASLLATVFLYAIVLRHTNQTIALLAAFFYAFLPYNIFYGRTILPDQSMIMAILGGIYFFDLWIEQEMEKKDRKKNILFFSFALLFTASSFLLKPTALFFTLPMLVLAYQAFRLKLFIKWQLWVLAFLSLVPLLWWRQWMQQFPEGIPANTWLLNGNGIRFRPAFFRWMGYERVVKLISGYSGVIFLLIGFVYASLLKRNEFLLSFLVSSVLYITVFATGNVQHDYYQIPVIPSLCILYAFGTYYLFVYCSKLLNKQVAAILVSFIILSMFWFGWNQIKDYFNINNGVIVTAGQAVDRLTPKSAKIIALYDGDTTLLYHTKRKGWPSYEKSLEELTKMGASYIVFVNPKPQDFALEKRYRLVEKTKEYVIYNLLQKP